METITKPYFRLWHFFLLFLFAAITMHAQKAGTSNESEEAKLSAEADKLVSQADEMRLKAENVSGEVKKMMLEEAVNFEKEAMRKRLAASTLKYTALRKRVVDNDFRIQKIRSALTASKQKTHTQFLVDDCHKNMRLADDMYKEAMASNNLAAQLGSMENAYDKISIALQEQDDIALMLKEEQEARKVASAK